MDIGTGATTVIFIRDYSLLKSNGWGLPWLTPDTTFYNDTVHHGISFIQSDGWAPVSYNDTNSYHVTNSYNIMILNPFRSGVFT